MQIPQKTESAQTPGCFHVIHSHARQLVKVYCVKMWVRGLTDTVTVDLLRAELPTTLKRGDTIPGQELILESSSSITFITEPDALKDILYNNYMFSLL